MRHHLIRYPPWHGNRPSPMRDRGNYPISSFFRILSKFFHLGKDPNSAQGCIKRFLTIPRSWSSSVVQDNGTKASMKPMLRQWRRPQRWDRQLCRRRNLQRSRVTQRSTSVSAAKIYCDSRLAVVAKSSFRKTLAQSSQKPTSTPLRGHSTRSRRTRTGWTRPPSKPVKRFRSETVGAHGEPHENLEDGEVRDAVDVRQALQGQAQCG